MGHYISAAPSPKELAAMALLAGADGAGSSGSGQANEWRAWPGGQADTDLNPKEAFSSADFGLTGKVDWTVGTGGVAALILETGTTTATNRDKITVRYDTRSPSAAKASAAMVQAIKGAETKTKHRTVFSVSWSLKFAGKLNIDDDLRHPGNTGTNTDECEFNWDGERGASKIAAKMEATCAFLPTGVDWGARGVSFEYSTAPGAKFSFRLMRLKIATFVGQVFSHPNRTVLVDDPSWSYDLPHSFPGDTQYPTLGKPNRSFAIDGPGFSPAAASQAALRGDLRELAEWHDGVKWRQISISAQGEWHVNATAILPFGSKGGTNDDGAGVPAGNVPNTRPVANAGPAQTVASAAVVTLDGSASADADNDTLRYNWVQTTGPAVILSNPSAQKPTFTAPAGPTAITFELRVFSRISG